MTNIIGARGGRPGGVVDICRLATATLLYTMHAWPKTTHVFNSMIKCANASPNCCVRYDDTRRDAAWAH